MPPNSPTPNSDAGGTYNPYGAANDSTTVNGIADIFNLDQIGSKEVPLALATRGSFGPAALPHGVYRDQFAQANDMPAGGPIGPVSDTIKNIVLLYAQRAYTSPQEYTALQQTLFAGGFYGNKKATDITWGSWGTDTKDALVQALVDTAQLSEAGAPITFSDYIKDRADKRSKLGTPAQTEVNQYTDPAAVVQSAKDAATHALGRELTAKEAQGFESYFHSQERAYNVEANAASEGAAPVVDVSRPDLGAEAQQYVESHYGHELGAQRGADYITALHQLLTGGG